MTVNPSPDIPQNIPTPSNVNVKGKGSASTAIPIDSIASATGEFSTLHIDQTTEMSTPHLPPAKQHNVDEEITTLVNSLVDSLQQASMGVNKFLKLTGEVKAAQVDHLEDLYEQQQTEFKNAQDKSKTINTLTKVATYVGFGVSLAVGAAVFAANPVLGTIMIAATVGFFVAGQANLFGKMDDAIDKKYGTTDENGNVQATKKSTNIKIGIKVGIVFGTAGLGFFSGVGFMELPASLGLAVSLGSQAALGTGLPENLAEAIIPLFGGSEEEQQKGIMIATMVISLIAAVGGMAGGLYALQGIGTSSSSFETLTKVFSRSVAIMATVSYLTEAGVDIAKSVSSFELADIKKQQAATQYAVDTIQTIQKILKDMMDQDKFFIKEFFKAWQEPVKILAKTLQSTAQISQKISSLRSV